MVSISIGIVNSTNEGFDNKNDEILNKELLSTNEREISKITKKNNQNSAVCIHKKRRHKRQHRQDKGRCFTKIVPQEHQEHFTLIEKVRERYGGTRKKRDELKEAMFDTIAKRPLHPASYQRMMQRVMDSHLNRLLQPEPTINLLSSNLCCALCFQNSEKGENQLGELFGPYFVFLSVNCQPPEQLMPKALLSQEKSLQNKETSIKSHLSGSLDVWIHGECALKTPDLFLVGGKFPNLQMNIWRYWKQKCTRCGNIGASIPVELDMEQESADKMASATKRKGQSFMHYKCAAISEIIEENFSMESKAE